MTIQFWIHDPTVLFNKEYIFEIWPSSWMTFVQKLNAMTRLIILLTILGYIVTKSLRIVVVGLCTLLAIFVLFHMKKKDKHVSFEGFEPKPANEEVYNKETIREIVKTEFKEGTKKNPFSNVLLTQIGDDPDRKAAPPAFNLQVDEDITKNVKKTIQMLNPGIKNTNKQLFGDLWQQFQLDNCLRVFNTTPNSRVTNDQGAYAQYLYNDLKYSGKESTPEGAIARVKDNWRWIDG